MTTHNTHCKCNCTCQNDKACVIFPEAILNFIEQCKKDEHPESQLIAVLHKVQDHFGYLSQEAMDKVAYIMQIPAAKVSGVASFYHLFCLEPRGKFIISICMGTACYVKGADAVLKKFQEELGIQVGETTKDGLFTLEIARCLGTCALAPVVKVGEAMHSEITPDRVPALIEHYITLAKK